MSHIIGDMTMEDLSAVRRMIRPDAEGFLQKFTLTDEERESVMKLVGLDLPKDMPLSPKNPYYDPFRKTWFAVGYLLGASLERLAQIHGIRRQTVSVHVSKVLSVPNRASMRLSTSLSLEALSAYRRKFYENKELLARMEPVKAALWLQSNTELDND